MATSIFRLGDKTLEFYSTVLPALGLPLTMEIIIISTKLTETEYTLLTFMAITDDYLSYSNVTKGF